ncbi:uncharacterized protein DEA37_0003797 [Paragonimus westermani]|uniref:Uncharacterized protein n=1 Tax=Paragonimus westermani TaxID=34504 RepID=A0A5J4P233_9TREM|nr:uncharacterized protein DEA37_0003797 [Paragonimus westermani]
MPDVGGEPYNDVCILRHSNRLCAVGLAPAHHLFKHCIASCVDPNQSVLPMHTLLGVDYRISPKLDRLQNITSGRRKRGAQQVGRAPNVLAFAVCDRMVKHKLILGIPGRLIEVNRAVTYIPASTTLDNSVLEDNSPLSLGLLNPLGGSPDRNYGDAGTYLCIIAPSLRPRRKRGSKKQRMERRQTESVVDLDLTEGHLSAASSDDTTENDEGDSTCLSSTEPWINRMSDLTGETVLTWKQYSHLRKL